MNPTQIQEAINILQAEQAKLDLTSLVTMTQRVNEAMVKVTLHPDNADARNMLELSVSAREQVRVNHQRAHAITVELDKLEQQRQIHVENERQHARQAAQQQFADAVADYKRRALDVTRSYRELLTLARSQGKDLNMLPSFTFSHLSSDPNGHFKISDEMQMGRMRFEPQPEVVVTPHQKSVRHWMDVAAGKVAA